MLSWPFGPHIVADGNAGTAGRGETAYRVWRLAFGVRRSAFSAFWVFWVFSAIPAIPTLPAFLNYQALLTFHSSPIPSPSLGKLFSDFFADG